MRPMRSRAEAIATDSARPEQRNGTLAAREIATRVPDWDPQPRRLIGCRRATASASGTPAAKPSIDSAPQNAGERRGEKRGGRERAAPGAARPGRAHGTHTN